MKLINTKKIDRCFKGDQNIFWDGWICNLALKRYLLQNHPTVSPVFFIHDEKLGSPDLNWAYYAQDQGQCFFITDDYADSFGDACYINIDLSCGLFYLPVISPKRLESKGIPLKSIAKSYKRYQSDLDPEFIEQMFSVGVDLHLPVPLKDEHKKSTENYMDEYFFHHPDQKIYYIFSRAMGRKGIVPCKDSNMLFSSLFIQQPPLKNQLYSLFFTHFLRPLLKQAVDPLHEKIIRSRSLDLLKFLGENLKEKASLFDLQEKANSYFSSKVKTSFSFDMTQSSKISMNPMQHGIQHFFLQMALKDSLVFSDTYNKALDIEKKNIQRLNFAHQVIPLPFYLLMNHHDASMYRYPVYLDAGKLDQLFYKRQNKMEPVSELSKPHFIGKAMPFLNELSMAPHMMAMPEQGSQYSSACDSWVKLLRDRGKKISDLRLLRINLNTLDSFILAEDIEIQMPSFLSNFFGKVCTTHTISKSWKQKVSDSFKLLDFLEQFLPGQETTFLRKWRNDELPASETKIFESFLGDKMKKLLLNMFSEYQQLNFFRSSQKEQFSESDRYRLEILRFEMNFLFHYTKRNLLQFADGLTYWNHRPYFLALFLFFGESFIIKWLQQVTFRVETL